MVQCIRYYAILYGIQTFPDFGKVSDSCLAVMSTCMSHLSNVSVNLVFMLLPVNSASPQPMATFLRSTKTQRYRMLIPPRMFFPVSFYTDICLKQTLNRHCLTNSLPLRFPVHSDCSSLCHLQPEMTILGVSKESQDHRDISPCFFHACLPSHAVCSNYHTSAPKLESVSRTASPHRKSVSQQCRTGDGTVRDHLLFFITCLTPPSDTLP